MLSIRAKFFRGNYSTFWICSRIFSSSVFAFTTCWARVASFAFEPMVLNSRLSSWQRKSRDRPEGWSESRYSRNLSKWDWRRVISSVMSQRSAKMPISFSRRSSVRSISRPVSWRRLWRFSRCRVITEGACVVMAVVSS